MPASSIDTFFACSLMVILVVSAMVSTAKLVQPYLTNIANSNGIDRYRSFADYVLLNPGTPSDWGGVEGESPSVFGLASGDSQPYALDPDKVSRLNNESVYATTYEQVLASLGAYDMSFNIQLRTVFDVTISPPSTQGTENDTTYTFPVSTIKSGLPISAWLSCYVILDSYVDEVVSSTDTTGSGEISVSLSNSLNGTALLAVLARMQTCSQIMTFNAYSFGHNTDPPSAKEPFLRLSPLNHMLNVSFQQPELDIDEALVLTYSHCLSLSPTALGNQSVEYNISSPSETSPMILAVTGHNGSVSFAEWTAYPQLPLEMGAPFDDLHTETKALALTYIVSVNAVLYEAIVTVRSVPETGA